MSVASPSSFAPALTFWPGAVILTEAADSGTTNGGEPRLYTDMAGQTGITVGGYINSYGANVPTVFDRWPRFASVLWTLTWVMHHCRYGWTTKPPGPPISTA